MISFNNNEARPKFTGSYKKKSVYTVCPLAKPFWKIKKIYIDFARFFDVCPARISILEHRMLVWPPLKTFRSQVNKKTI